MFPIEEKSSQARPPYKLSNQLPVLKTAVGAFYKEYMTVVGEKLILQIISSLYLPHWPIHSKIAM